MYCVELRFRITAGDVHINKYKKYNVWDLKLSLFENKMKIKVQCQSLSQRHEYSELVVSGFSCRHVVLND